VNLSMLWFVVPPMILAAWAQSRVQSTYAQAMRVPAPVTGAAAARFILDQSGLTDVQIEEVAGTLTDHYDPTARVLRLSRDVYRQSSAAAVGIAAHEAGHAIQHATHYGPLVVRNLAVPLANWGTTMSGGVMAAGITFQSLPIVLAGVGLVSMVAVFQLINLPVEFDASNRAKRLLAEHGIVDDQGGSAVRSVLNAAAWTYVAATLTSVLKVLMILMQVLGSRRSERR
jgi:uncharacterized protein